MGTKLIATPFELEEPVGKKAKKFFEEKSENLATKPFTKYFEDEKFCSIHIRDSEADSFREIFGRILCEHPNCRNKPFKSRVS